jgi:hypothetical protein
VVGGRWGVLEERLAGFEQCERDWLGELSEGVHSFYSLYWQEFKDFVGMKASEILDLRAQDLKLLHTDRGRWRFEGLAKRFYRSLYRSRDPPHPTGTDRVKLTAVQSFFSHHRMDLKFKRGELEQPILTTRYYDIRLIDVKEAVKVCSLEEKWIVLGGKSLGQRVGVFAKIRKDEVKPLLEEEPPVPIDIRTHKKNLWAHPCLDRDALEAAKELLAIRNKEEDNNPYLLKGKGDRPMTRDAINKAVRRVADKAHAVNPKTWRYVERGENLRFHQFRKFLNSSLQTAGIVKDVRNYVIGHKLSGTDRAYTADLRRKAYQDAESYMIISRTSTPEMERVKKEMLLELWREQAKMLGIDPLKVRIERQKDLGREPDLIEEKEALQNEIKKMTVTASKTASADDCQKIVSEEDLPYMLDRGWRVVTTLPSGKIIIED